MHKKPSNYQRPPSGGERALSPTQINDLEEPDGRSTSRGRSNLTSMCLLTHEIHSSIIFI